jgi:transposase
LDVHAAKVVAAVVDGGSGELSFERLPGATERVVEFCCGLPSPTSVAFEAGPTGFGLARALEARGVAVWWRRRGRSRGRLRIVSRPTAAMRSGWCGC